MNRILFSLAILAMFFSCSNKESKPGLFIPDQKINLNTIKFDSTYIISYKLSNNGKGMLVIDTASSSCDCTVPVIGKKPIRPGDSSILTVQYKPVDTGLFDKKVVIKSNIDSSFSIVSFNGRAIK